MANRVVDLLSRLFNMAEAWGVAPDGGNPCRFVQKYKERSRERFLSEEEFGRLGSVLDELEAEGKVSANAVAAIRLLMLTGCRRGEIVTLRWEDVDLEAGELRLRDAKTGPRQVALSPAAVRVLSAILRHADYPWVIAGRKPGYAACEPQRIVARRTRSCGPGRRTSTRSASQLRFEGTRIGREPVNDRDAARSPKGADDRALRPPCAGLGEGFGGEGRGKSQGRYGEGWQRSGRQLMNIAKLSGAGDVGHEYNRTA